LLHLWDRVPFLLSAPPTRLKTRSHVSFDTRSVHLVHAEVASERTDRVIRCHLVGPHSVHMSHDSVIVHMYSI
jgi:hypothetical protein